LFADVGAVDDFTEGGVAKVTVEKRDYGVVRWRDDFFVFRNICPHVGADLCDGAVGRALTSRGPLSSPEAHDDRPIVICPWHRWSFEVDSGRSLHDPDRWKIRSFATEIREGRVLADVARPPRGSRETATTGAGAQPWTGLSS
jgi:nitrite reductase (NADH) small subunit